MENKKTIELLQELVKKNPNDMELGKEIRKMYPQKISEAEPKNIGGDS